MDQESGVASTGSFLSLSEQEQRFYSGLHGLCAADSSGKKLSSSKVAELIKASQLPAEALHKVTEVCGAKRLGYFGTAQFYVALKLLAAAQSGLPIHLESITANLPLPRFAGLKNEPEMRYSTVTSIDGQAASCGTAPVTTTWTPSERSTFRPLDANVEKKEPWSPPRSPSSSPPRSPLAYRSYQYAKQRNGADVHASYESKHSSLPIAQLEQHSSPGNYGTKAEHPAMALASSSERLEQQESADYSDEDPWRITEEQLEYYTNQFKSLQPDLGALILGTIAKNFFTKSKLPIPELSHIWELSDVDRDGALTFSEFCTAFHLIVARKNGYPLPESLPPTLRPGFLQQEADVPDTPESAGPLIVFEDADLRPNQMDHRVIERLQPSIASTKQDLQGEAFKQDVGMKRATKSLQRQTLQLGAFRERPAASRPGPTDADETRPRSYSSTSIEDAMKKAEEPPTPPPRPQKSHSRASSLDLNKLFQQGAPGAQKGEGRYQAFIVPYERGEAHRSARVKSGWLPPPPALPPRPATSQVPHFITVPEKTPPTNVQQPNFADFSHFREEEESGVKPQDQGPRSRFGQSNEDLTSASKQDIIAGSHNQAPQKPVRRKFHPESQNLDPGPPSNMLFPPTNKPAQKLQSKQKREIQMAIRKNKETNAVLTRLNSELQQQLKVVHQERVTLESQLELLRPLAST